MFEVGVVSQFEAAHTLQGDFGPATRLHGHTYRVEVDVRGPALRDDGTLCDIGRLQGIVQDIVGALHYRNLDEHPGFAGRNSTAEALAYHLWQQIAPQLADEPIESLLVRVWESPQAHATYDAPL